MLGGDLPLIVMADWDMMLAESAKLTEHIDDRGHQHIQTSARRHTSFLGNSILYINMFEIGCFENMGKTGTDTPRISFEKHYGASDLG